MSELQPYRAMIEPVPAGMKRPIWSLMIPTYHCAGYLRETLATVLAQDPGPDVMQIEVVDDCSTEDDPAAVVAEMGNGRVDFYRQPANVGHVANFNSCLQRSRGRLVHLLHGDDSVRPGFYGRMEAAFCQRPDIGAAFCRYISMDEQGHWQTIWPLEQSRSGVLENWLEKIAAGQRLQPPAMVVRREVYERLGGFDRRIRHYGEDWEMWVRIAAAYPVWYEVEPLALYRVRTASLTHGSMRTGENVQELRRVIEICQDYLPPERAGAIARDALQSAALAALRRARRIIHSDELETPLVQMREAYRCSRSAAVLAQIGYVAMVWCWKRMVIRAD
jgi:glycosyltransferase involved in cell wall biosynthesis